MERGVEIGPEVDDKDLLDFPDRSFSMRLLRTRRLVGKTMKEIAALEFARGVFLQKLLRAGETMPFTPETKLDRGDMLSLVGARRDVERAAKEIGYAERPTVSTDMIFVGLGIFFGGLIGIATVVVGGLPHHPHRQRRRPDYGSGLRLAPVGPSDLRPYP